MVTKLSTSTARTSSVTSSSWVRELGVRLSYFLNGGSGKAGRKRNALSESELEPESCRADTPASCPVVAGTATVIAQVFSIVPAEAQICLARRNEQGVGESVGAGAGKAVGLAGSGCVEKNGSKPVSGLVDESVGDKGGGLVGKLVDEKVGESLDEPIVDEESKKVEKKVVEKGDESPDEQVGLLFMSQSTRVKSGAKVPSHGSVGMAVRASVAASVARKVGASLEAAIGTAVAELARLAVRARL